MNVQFQHHLPEDFNDASKVWIYQANRLLTVTEALKLEETLEEFTKGWKSHGADVKGYANLFFGQFIILMADESAAGVSGCSTDSSVRLIKSIEQDLNIHLFDRQLLAFIVKERIQLLPLPQLDYAIENKFITPDALYFNNTVQTKKELVNNWIIPVKQSWLGKRFPVLDKA